MGMNITTNTIGFDLNMTTQHNEFELNASQNKILETSYNKMIEEDLQNMDIVSEAKEKNEISINSEPSTTPK